MIHHDGLLFQNHECGTIGSKGYTIVYGTTKGTLKIYGRLREDVVGTLHPSDPVVLELVRQFLPGHVVTEAYNHPAIRLLHTVCLCLSREESGQRKYQIRGSSP